MVLHNIATTIIANHVKSEAGKAGTIGLLAGLAATTVLRRSVPGAIIVGGVVVARQLIKLKQKADARRAAEAGNPTTDAKPKARKTKAQKSPS